MSQIRFDVFSLFPEVFEPYLQTSILQRARQNLLVEIHLHNIRDWTTDRHRTTDDEPFGGGGGMVMKPEPIFAAVESILGAPPAGRVILLSPQGRLFNQSVAQELATTPNPSPGQPARLALICGRYEGIDERVCQYLANDEISIGDYVLTGGELAALVVMDAVSRLVPGVLGDPQGATNDSHATGLLEYPHYTRPADFRGWRAPPILLSGDHARVERWRREQALLRTWQRRPDLLKAAPLSSADLKFLASLEAETGSPAGPTHSDPETEEKSK